MERNGADTKLIMKNIDDLVVKTLITAQPTIKQIIEKHLPDDIEN